MMLRAEHLCCGYGRATVVGEVSLSVAPGEILCLLGPNGAGKTTLFRTLLGLQRPLSGRVSLDGKELRAWPRQALARKLGYVPQSHVPPFPFRVADIVVMGRAPYLGPFSAPGRADWEAVDAALGAVGATHLCDTPYTELSGGEQRLVLIARVLVQRPSVLVLDEPTSNLDYGNQIRLLRHLQNLATKGYGIVMTTHTPDHALHCGTAVALLFGGRMQSYGAPRTVITEAAMFRMYGERIQIISANGMTSTTAAPMFPPTHEVCHAANQ